MFYNPGNISNNPVMQRFLANPTTPEEATWVCDTCGVIAPRPRTLNGETRYLKEKCTCQLTEEERLRHEERRQEWMQWQRGRTFSWLGSRWDDSVLLEKTFDNFERQIQPNAYDTIRAFIMRLKGTLVLHGTFGTGKTHLLAALCNEIRYAEKGSLFTTAPKLFAAIQSRISSHEDYSSIIDNAMKTSLLVIDDIDKAKHSDFREEIYFEIVDERVKAGRPIAISTNRLDELADFVGGAVCSRLKVGQIDVPMLGEDYRETLDIA